MTGTHSTCMFDIYFSKKESVRKEKQSHDNLWGRFLLALRLWIQRLCVEENVAEVWQTSLTASIFWSSETFLTAEETDVWTHGNRHWNGVWICGYRSQIVWFNPISQRQTRFWLIRIQIRYGCQLDTEIQKLFTSRENYDIFYRFVSIRSAQIRLSKYDISASETIFILESLSATVEILNGPMIYISANSNPHNCANHSKH